MKLPLRPPLDPCNRGDRLDTIDLFGPVSGHVPHFHHLVPAPSGQPSPTMEIKGKSH